MRTEWNQIDVRWHRCVVMMGEETQMMNPVRSDPIPTSSLFLSTSGLPVRDRLAVWREVFGRMMVRLDMGHAKDTSFHAEGELLMLPGAACGSVAATPFRVSHTRRPIAGDEADVVFLVTADVPPHVAQNGCEQILDAGDAIFVRGGERSVIQSRDRARLTNISIPIDHLTPLLSTCLDPLMIVIRRQNDVFDLLLGYVRLLHARQKQHSGEFARLAAGHIRDLIAIMIGADPTDKPSAHERGGVRAARLRAIKANIGGQLCDPGLSMEAIAMSHGISPRYLRKLFQEGQTTFSDFVLSLRLERSRQLLRTPAHSACTIASIRTPAASTPVLFQSHLPPQIRHHAVGFPSRSPVGSDLQRAFSKNGT